MIDIREYLLQGLERDDRYKQILSGVQDQQVQEQIDVTVREFLAQVAGGMEQLQRAMADPTTRQQLEETLGKRVK